MGRKILFVTTDQQRWDSLGCTGNEFCRTPNIDALAASGINYTRGYNQNTVCMPARSSILTGQYVRTHGVFANGVPLPTDAPSFAQYLKDKAGYKTALIGKAHFEPGFDPQFKFLENSRQREGNLGPWRGFDYAIHAMHIASFGGRPVGHYGRWLREKNKEVFDNWPPLLNASPGGDTGAPETSNHNIPREFYHTDWLAGLALDWLDKLETDDDWMLWLSFPDPHHPWDPPVRELGRCDWRGLPLPDGYPGSPDEIRKILARKPAHWLDYYEGKFVNAEGGPQNFRPQQLSSDNIREINAKVHVMNELIDEAVGKGMTKIKARGWNDDTDVVFTTDHGELQGDSVSSTKGRFTSMRLCVCCSSGGLRRTRRCSLRQSVIPSNKSISRRRFVSWPASSLRHGCRAGFCPFQKMAHASVRSVNGTVSFRVTASTSAQSTAMAMYLRVTSLPRRANRTVWRRISPLTPDSKRISAMTVLRASCTISRTIRCNGTICGTIANAKG
ncbi:MAG: sulfatase family protein [Rhizomicrobium sp.]